MIKKIIADHMGGIETLPAVECCLTGLLVCVAPSGEPNIVTRATNSDTLVGVSLRFGDRSTFRPAGAFFEFEETCQLDVINKYANWGWVFFHLEDEKDLARWLLTL